MHIKSLLIGSAAALVAAPAFAADVIIAEPEPVEYVEVCDVAGAGYFYIPGSRTCLQISGLVRHELQFGDDAYATTRVVDPVTAAAFGVPVGSPVGRTFTPGASSVDGQNDGIDSLVRAELTVRTFTETELGDLTSFIRFRANDTNDGALAIVANNAGNQINQNLGASTNGSAFVQDATIGLGGLLMGLSDTLYDGGINGEFDAGGGARVHFIRYTADLGAFSASLSLEAERSFDSRFDYVPNVVGNISGDIGAFSVDLWAAYDDQDEVDIILPVAPAGTIPATVLAARAANTAAALGTGGVFGPVGSFGVPATVITNDDEFALKARVGFDLGIAEVQALATYNSGDNFYGNGPGIFAGLPVLGFANPIPALQGFANPASVFTPGVTGIAALALSDTYEWSVGASAKVGLGEKASLTFGGQYFANNYIAGTDFETEADAFTVGANVDYEIVDGFDVKVAANYVGVANDDVFSDAIVAGAARPNAFQTDVDGYFTGFIRFDRSF